MRTIRFFIDRNHRILELLPALLIGSVFIWIHASTHPWNSDHLYFEAILRDLFSDRAALKEFHFSASTFLLPDSIIYIPLRLLTQNIGCVLFFYMIIQYFGLLLFIQQLAGNRGNYLFFCASALAFFGLLDAQWFSILYPVHHGGQWIWGMLLLSKLDPLKHLSARTMTLGSLISAGLASSDLLFGFTGIGPYVLWSVERARGHSTWNKVRSIAIWSVFTLFAILSAYFLFRYLTGSYFGWNKPLPGLILDRARIFIRDFFTLKSSILMCLSVIYLFGIRKRIDSAGFLSYSALFSVGAVIATGVWAAPENVRYIQPLSIALIWAIGFWVSGLPYRVLRWAILVLLIALSGAQGWKDSLKFKQSPLENPYLPAHACLDNFILESGLREGIGDYWSAKWLTFFSKEHAKILQVTPDLEPHYWINNHAWYHDFKPRFVIINFFSSTRIAPDEIRFLGQPSMTFTCSGFDIWVYPPGTIQLKAPPPTKHSNFQEFRN